MEKVHFKEEESYLFGFCYYGKDIDDVIVAKPTKIYKDKILFHFLYGYKSLGEFVRKEDVVAVGDSVKGTFSVVGWNGNFRIINQKLFDEYHQKGILKLK